MDTEPSRPRVLASPFLALTTLLIANALTVILFMSGDASLMQVLWSYWLQSIIIGIINVVRVFMVPIKGETDILLGLQNVHISGPLSSVGRSIMALFFMLHYGFFHFIYGLFLFALSQPNFTVNFGSSSHTLDLDTGVSLGAVLLCGLAFAVHHAISFAGEYRYIKLHPEAAPSAGDVLMRPYARILPMHLIIIFGPMVAVLVGSNPVFILFMIFKTVADLELFRRGSGHPSTFSAMR